jgi:hypothetical protein
MAGANDRNGDRNSDRNSDRNTGGMVPSLLGEPPRVINIGLERFAHDLAEQGAAVQQVQWSPPAGGDPKLAALLSRLGS